MDACSGERTTESLGLSLEDEADSAMSLGIVQTINLGGGRSAQAVAGGSVLNSPSGGTERGVGDAFLVMPGRPENVENQPGQTK